MSFPLQRPKPAHLPSKVILTDVDDALLDWSTPFIQWVRDNASRFTPICENLRDCENIETWLNCNYTETRELIAEFNGHPEIWPYFKPLPGAQEAVKRLVDDGYRFVAITACDQDEWTHTNRWNNLQQAFGGAFDTLHCVGLGGSKYEYLARYRPTYWVEDNWGHAVHGADLDHTSFLLDYKHSRHQSDSRVHRVSNWSEIADHVLADLRTETIKNSLRRTLQKSGTPDTVIDSMMAKHFR